MFDYDVVLTGAGLTEEQARQRYDDAVRVCRWEHKDVLQNNFFIRLLKKIKPGKDKG
ncbi:MAG: hypothetical protein ACYTE3_30750 [Planctomycetota bacterium]|jgi:hypothetical protein